MKLLRIVERDPGFYRSFRSMLIQIGSAPVAGDSTLFEVHDDFDADKYHGVEIVTSRDKPLPFAEKYAAEIAWLNAYKGTFDFYLSLKSQFFRKGSLSPAQIAAVTKAIARDKERAEAPAKPQSFTIEPGTIISVSRWMAQQYARQVGLTNPHFGFEVTEVLAETPAAYQLKLRFSAQRTTHCCRCGIELTNPDSIAMGIGPICAEKSGIGGMQVEALADQLAQIAEVTTWIPKRSIKRRFEKRKEVA